MNSHEKYNFVGFQFCVPFFDCGLSALRKLKMQMIS